jgi:hypothetical protein
MFFFLGVLSWVSCPVHDYRLGEIREWTHEGGLDIR